MEFDFVWFILYIFKKTTRILGPFLLLEELCFVLRMKAVTINISGTE